MLRTRAVDRKLCRWLLRSAPLQRLHGVIGKNAIEMPNIADDPEPPTILFEAAVDPWRHIAAFVGRPGDRLSDPEDQRLLSRERPAALGGPRIPKPLQELRVGLAPPGEHSLFGSQRFECSKVLAGLDDLYCSVKHRSLWHTGSFELISEHQPVI